MRPWQVSLPLMLAKKWLRKPCTKKKKISYRYCCDKRWRYRLNHSNAGSIYSLILLKETIGANDPCSWYLPFDGSSLLFFSLTLVMQVLIDIFNLWYLYLGTYFIGYRWIVLHLPSSLHFHSSISEPAIEFSKISIIMPPSTNFVYKLYY